MLDGTPIIVSAARGDQCAGVRRDDDGQLWMAHWSADRPDRVGGTRLDGLRPARITGPGWLAIGGRLPDGGRTVRVSDDGGAWQPAAVAGGAWVAFVAHSGEAAGLPPVRVLDDDGALVFRADRAWLQTARPLRDDEARLAGRDGVCPACGARDWRAAPAGTGGWDASSADGGPPVHVFCAVCGENDGAVSVFFAATRKG